MRRKTKKAKREQNLEIERLGFSKGAPVFVEVRSYMICNSGECT
jgi:hypothetical protein